MACIISVGGIYTVIKTKAAVTVEELGEQYCLIGPYNESCVRTEVEIMEPANDAMRRALEQMRSHGINVRFSQKTSDFVCFIEAIPCFQSVLFPMMFLSSPV